MEAKAVKRHLEELESKLATLLYDGKVYTSEETINALRTAQDTFGRMIPDQKTGLLPCGCGGWARSAFRDDNEAYPYFVVCTECFIMTDNAKTPEDAIALWNKAIGGF